MADKEECKCKHCGEWFVPDSSRMNALQGG